MTATAMRDDRQTIRPQLTRTVCTICHQPVLWIIVRGTLVLVDLYEWLPRSACQSCLHTRRAHPGRPVSCSRCGDTGMVGERRPAGRMVAIDIAWSDDDELHVRIVGPTVDRRRGEALHKFHVCAQIEPVTQRKEQEAA